MIEKGEEPRSSAVKMKIRAKKQTANEKNGGISRKIKNLWRDVAARLKQKFVKNVVQDLTSGGIDWQREKWQSGLGSKFIHQGEKNAAKYADEVRRMRNLENRAAEIVKAELIYTFERR